MPRKAVIWLYLLRAACQIDASSNLHAGEKSPDFAIKPRIDVSSRVPKVTSAAYDSSSIPPSGTAADSLNLRHVEVATSLPHVAL